jgi:hypothetical protein
MAAETRIPVGRDRSVPPTARAMGPVNRRVARAWEAMAVPAIRAVAPVRLTPAAYQNGPVRVWLLRRWYS